MECKKIVAAVDLGPDTEAVIAYSAWLAGATGQCASLILLHVMDYALTPPAYLVRYIEDEEKRNMAELDRWARRLKDERGVAAGYEMVMGRLVEAVGSHIRETKTDVLVIGYRHHMVRSSSAGRLIRSLRQPILVVRGARSRDVRLGAAAVRRILCPVDFSENSLNALQWAGHIAKGCNAEIVILNVEPVPNLPPGIEGEGKVKEMESHQAKALADAEAELSRLAGGIEAGLQISVIARSGVPVEAINEISNGMNIDLVVMGARGKTFFEGLLLGSVSESVVRSSPCPVLIVH